MSLFLAYMRYFSYLYCPKTVCFDVGIKNVVLLEGKRTTFEMQKDYFFSPSLSELWRKPIFPPFVR